MKLNFEIDEAELRKIILAHIQDTTGLQLKEEDLEIMVKSKQNYKSEWERAEFKAKYVGKI